MPQEIRFLTDTTCDLPAQTLAELNIPALPMHVALGGQDHLDGVDVTRQQLYDYAKRTRQLPKTAAVSEQQFLDAFTAAFDGGCGHLFYLGLSSLLTSAYQNALAAREEMAKRGIERERIHVLDSRQLSTGTAHLLIEGSAMAREGLEPGEIERRLKELKRRLSTSFVVDTLEYLHMGGRCSSVAYVAGSMLRLHPQINMDDGAMHVGDKFRGGIARCIEQYEKKMVEDKLKEIEPRRIFITHTCEDETMVREAYERLKALGYFEDIRITEAGATISSHCGPNTLGFLYIRRA